MIESIDNILQIILTGTVTGIAVYRSLADRRREWILIGLFSGAFFLGDVYYILDLILYSDTTFDPFIPYLCWYTAYYFLVLLILFLKDGKRGGRPFGAMLLIPVFSVGMCIFFIRMGDVISNLISCVLMTLIMWNAADGLRLLKAENEAQDSKKWIYISVFVFCLLEYALWISSCFWMGDHIYNPYFWIDTLISVCFLLLMAAVRKAVDT